MTLLSKIFLYRKWSFLLLHHSTFLRYLDRGVVSLSRMIVGRDLVVLFPIILTSLAVISRTSSFLKNEMARSSMEPSSVSWCCRVENTPPYCQADSGNQINRRSLASDLLVNRNNPINQDKDGLRVSSKPRSLLFTNDVWFRSGLFVCSCFVDCFLPT